MRVKTAALIAAASIVALGLGACTAQPGTAVSVNGVAYSEADITRGVEDYAELTGQPLDRSTVVRMVPDALKFTELATELDLPAGDEQVQAYLDDLVASGKVAAPEHGIGKVMTEILRYTVISTQINTLDQATVATAQEKFQEIADSQQVEINPRYGTSLPDGTTALPKFADVVDTADLAALEGSDGSAPQS
ncbi:hypothetical protein [Schaalia hyovaginalis]|uniref:hypothetical protein n=1 Tax=Schaalia hyovaginalis TaxID=29316 RepID=UPI0026F10DDA|nr:hypothetical protein [Schaalia hyovaginalis]MCI7513899.1 hypothetical protein [Schaalia hyovaginalis]